MSYLDGRTIEYLNSLGLYLRHIWKHWHWLAITVLAGSVGTVQEVNPKFVVPAWLWLVFAGVSLAIASFLAFDDIRRERDQAVGKLEAAAKFPDVRIEAPSVQRRDTREYPRCVVALQITNRESRRLSLSLQPLVKLVREEGAHALLYSEDLILRGRRLQESREEERPPSLASPLQVEPLSTITLDYGITWSKQMADRCALPPQESAAVGARPDPFNPWGDQLRLDVFEYISGQHVTIDIPGAYDERDVSVPEWLA